VSRKYTQFDEVSEETAIRYLKELEEKYSPGSIIADVPSNNIGSNKKKSLSLTETMFCVDK